MQTFYQLNGFYICECLVTQLFHFFCFILTNACLLPSQHKKSISSMCTYNLPTYSAFLKETLKQKIILSNRNFQSNCLPLPQCSKLGWGGCWRENKVVDKTILSVFMKVWSKSNLALNSSCKSPDPPLSLPLLPQSDIPIFLCRHGWFYGPKRGTFHYFLGKAK